MNTTASPFTSHSQTVPLRDIITPRRVTTEIRHVNSACVAANDEFTAELKRQERQRAADIAHEEKTEGRPFPHRIDRNE